MHTVYILYSNKLQRFYIGETADLEKRIEEHNSGFYKGAFTKVTDDWELFLEIPCENRITARKIEMHIKKMKSKKFIEDLVKYPELVSKLLSKY